MLPFTEWVWSQVRWETKKWRIHLGVRPFIWLKHIKLWNCRCKRARIIPAKVRIHPPQPQAMDEPWNQEFMEVLIFGRYLGISFTYYFHCYDKWHEYPDQITSRRHPATETKQKKSRNCWMCLFVPNASLNRIPIILIYCTLLYIRQLELLLKCFFVFHFRFNAIIKQNIY